MEYIPKEIIKDHILPYLESNVRRANQLILVETLCFPNSDSIEIKLSVSESVLYKNKCNSFTSIDLSFDIEESEITSLKEKLDDQEELVSFDGFLIHKIALVIKRDGFSILYFDCIPSTIIEIINIAMDNMGNLEVAKEKISKIPKVKLSENLKS